MGDEHAKDGPYHRRGQPGGPGCAVRVLAITLRGADGQPVDAELLDAGRSASEIELLRTLASRLGMLWGHDDFGWWAAVPRR